MNKFEIFRGTNRQFYFHLMANNGEIVLASEGYTTKNNTYKGVLSVKENAEGGKNFEIRKSKNDKFYFVLKAKNHKIIGVSQMYSSKQACERGVSAVQNASNQSVILEK